MNIYPIINEFFCSVFVVCLMSSYLIHICCPNTSYLLAIKYATQQRNYSGNIIHIISALEVARESYSDLNRGFEENLSRIKMPELIS